MKIVSVVGVRPQFVKMAPLAAAINSHNLRKGSHKIRHLIVHTGQHYDMKMSDLFFRELRIPKPKYNLVVGSGTNAYQTGSMLIRLEKVLIKEKPDMVLVYGDTNSTLAGALGAAKLNIPIAHIEAGLRSHRLDMPEEINRILTDHVSKLLFCPTKNAVLNLKKEGITRGVHLVGDLMYDIFRSSAKSANRRKVMSELGIEPKKYILLTIHRKENTDDLKSLHRIIDCLSSVKDRIVFPVHPRTRNVLQKSGKPSNVKNGSIIFIDPVGYLDMLALEKNAKKIITDSGGVQKEAYWFGVPCITIRRETEWVETVKGGRNILAGKDFKKLRALAENGSIPARYLSNGKYDCNKDAARVIIRLLRKQAGLC